MTTSSPDPATAEDAWARELAKEALSAPTCYFWVEDEWRLFNTAPLQQVLSDEQEALLGRSLVDSFLATTAQDHAAAVALAQPVLAFAIHADPTVVAAAPAVISG